MEIFTFRRTNCIFTYLHNLFVQTNSFAVSTAARILKDDLSKPIFVPKVVQKSPFQCHICHTKTIYLGYR